MAAFSWYLKNIFSFQAKLYFNYFLHIYLNSMKISAVMLLPPSSVGSKMVHFCIC